MAELWRVCVPLDPCQRFTPVKRQTLVVVYGSTKLTEPQQSFVMALGEEIVLAGVADDSRQYVLVTGGFKIFEDWPHNVSTDWAAASAAAAILRDRSIAVEPRLQTWLPDPLLDRRQDRVLASSSAQSSAHSGHPIASADFASSRTPMSSSRSAAKAIRRSCLILRMWSRNRRRCRLPVTTRAHSGTNAIGNPEVAPLPFYLLQQKVEHIRARRA